MIGRALAVVAALLSTSGCAALAQRVAPWPAGAAPTVEIPGVPFHPQTEHECGPAALATLLGAAGVGTTPEALSREVYLPGRRGSLQTELVAALRRRELLAHEIPPTLAALVSELESGRPVLVLQNFGVPMWPRWHYAVVVGFDRSADRLILRSGTRERLLMRRSWFESSWRRAGRWALVATRPDQIPVTASPERFLRSAADLESVGRSAAALRAYDAAITRWPLEPLARVALANAQLAAGHAERAEATLRAAAEAGATDAVVHNNLADLLARRGCRAAALEQAHIAAGFAAQPGSSPSLAGAVEATRREIEALPSFGAGEAACPRDPATPAR